MSSATPAAVRCADDDYDVAIIGAGVVGTAVARELAHRDLRVVVVDKASDVGEGTSKANTAILHTGFDATPGTLESRLVHRGHELLTDYATSTGIPVESLGALLVAWDAQEREMLPRLQTKAEANGYLHTAIISAAELYRREPHLGPGAVGALEVPDEGIICPWTTTLALATEALAGGVELRLQTPVHEITPGTGGSAHHIVTGRGNIRARFLVNAAGLWSDELDRQLGHDTFTVTPRRGELIVFDKLARPLVNHILLPVPSARGKGVLVAPTVYGNVMLGPTAEDRHDKTDTASSAEGLAFLKGKGAHIVPDLVKEEVTAVYAGLRAATEHADYQLRTYPDQRYVCVGGIRSTGLTASMAIAKYVVSLLADAGLDAGPRRDVTPSWMPNLGEATSRAYQRGDLIAADPDYGRIVCHCERVTRGEIRDATRSRLPPHTLDGLRRRTRALNGRCQGFYCGAEVRALLESLPPSPSEAAAPSVPNGPGETSPPVATPGVRAPAATTSPRAGTYRSTPVPAPPYERTVDVLIVGAGPAGLAAATALARAGAGQVEVLDREQHAGGIPRHSNHTGYGLCDLHRLMTGPAYARHYVDLAAVAGVATRTGVTATGWSGPLTLDAVGATGLERITAKAVILATGARERPRSARLVPGSRPAGVYTTGLLQQMVYLHQQTVGRRAVVVGAEHVSYSAAVTLDHAGARVAAMVTDLPRQQSYAAFRIGASLRYRFPVLTGTTVVRLIGRHRLEGVEIRRANGQLEVIDADTVVFTGDWIPDNELARRGGITIDAGTRGPAVDTGLRTSAPGVFAAGNLVHPVETAAAVALGGRHVAESVLGYLSGAQSGGDVSIEAAAPLTWIVPARVSPSAPTPPRNRFVVWTQQFMRRPTFEVRQGGQTLHRETRLRTLVPNRPYYLPASWQMSVVPGGGPVIVRVT